MTARLISADGIVEFGVWKFKDWAIVAAHSLQQAVYWFNAQSENAGEEPVSAADAVECSMPGRVNVANHEDGEAPVYRGYPELVEEHMRYGGTLPFYIAFTEP